MDKFTIFGINPIIVNTSKLIKGRGAQSQVSNRFFELRDEERSDFLNYCLLEGEDRTVKTSYIDTFPKSIVNKVDSPDVGMGWSLNPYQGCEHGCVYCYARNSHEYWGYGAGIDFESKILIKRTAPQLLEQKLKSKHWKAMPIALSGNTDCYQPIEKTLKITRQLLQVFLKYRHPVGIITKNALIQRDIDVLKELAEHNLVSVFISVTSLSEETRRVLEPRTATIKKRLQTIERLNNAGIPTSVMMAPIIPSINSHEILPLVKEVAHRGARHVGFTVVRLNGAIGAIFKEWISKVMPDRAEKVLNQIKACHGGSLNDSRFETRMKGEGKIAQQMHQQMTIARQKFMPRAHTLKLNCSLHEHYKTGQLSLF